MSVADHVARLVDILERHGVGGAEMKELADDVSGPRSDETGTRGKAEAKADAKSDAKSDAK